MTSTPNSNPKIVTQDNLIVFKNDLLATIGINTGNKSVIQVGNPSIKKTVTSAVFGSGHSVDLETLPSIKNILLAGQGNKASAWNQTIVGTFNKVNTDALFTVGYGSGDFDRQTAFEVLKDGTVTVNNNKLNYILTADEQTALSDINGASDLAEYLDTISDNTLIPAGIVKKLCASVAALTDTGVDIPQIKNELLITDVNDITGAENSKTLSAAVIKELVKAEVASLPDEKFGILVGAIKTLESEISYLISRITVARLNDAGEPEEYFAVGLADKALDLDTVIGTVSESEESEGED